MLGLGDGRRTSCDVTITQSNSSSALLNRGKKQATNGLIKGYNRPIENDTNYLYYVITSTPFGNETLYASSDQSKPFNSDESE